MEVVHERCAGIDISKVDVKVCVRVPSGKRRRSEVRTFSAVTSGLLAMRDWLLAEGVTVVGMPGHGRLLEARVLPAGTRHGVLAAQRPPHEVRAGRKTDVKDSERIAKLVEHGLVRPSFVPPEPIRQLRDVTRYRTEIIRERTRETQRLEKLLEDTGIKLSATVSNILGVSGRAMLEALIAGERDPRLPPGPRGRGLPAACGTRAGIGSSLGGCAAPWFASLAAVVHHAAVRLVERATVWHWARWLPRPPVSGVRVWGTECWSSEA